MYDANSRRKELYEGDVNKRVQAIQQSRMRQFSSPKVTLDDDPLTDMRTVSIQIPKSMAVLIVPVNTKPAWNDGLPIEVQNLVGKVAVVNSEGASIAHIDVDEMGINKFVGKIVGTQTTIRRVEASPKAQNSSPPTTKSAVTAARPKVDVNMAASRSTSNSSMQISSYQCGECRLTFNEFDPLQKHLEIHGVRRGTISQKEVQAMAMNTIKEVQKPVPGTPRVIRVTRQVPVTSSAAVVRTASQQSAAKLNPPPLVMSALTRSPAQIRLVQGKTASTSILQRRPVIGRSPLATQGGNTKQALVTAKKLTPTLPLRTAIETAMAKATIKKNEESSVTAVATTAVTNAAPSTKTGAVVLSNQRVSPPMVLPTPPKIEAQLDDDEPPAHIICKPPPQVMRKREADDTDPRGGPIKTKPMDFFSCDICSLTFLMEKYYEQHMKTHSTEVAANSILPRAAGLANRRKQPLSNQIRPEAKMERLKLERVVRRSIEPTTSVDRGEDIVRAPNPRFNFRPKVKKPRRADDPDSSKEDDDDFQPAVREKIPRAKAVQIARGEDTVEPQQLTHEAEEETYILDENEHESSTNATGGHPISMPSLDDDDPAALVQATDGEYAQNELDMAGMQQGMELSQGPALKYTLDENGQLVQMGAHHILTDADGNQIVLQGGDPAQLQHLLAGLQGGTVQMMNDENNQMIFVEQNHQASDFIEESIMSAGDEQLYVEMQPVAHQANNNENNNNGGVAELGMAVEHHQDVEFVEEDQHAQSEQLVGNGVDDGTAMYEEVMHDGGTTVGSS